MRLQRHVAILLSPLIQALHVYSGAAKGNAGRSSTLSVRMRGIQLDRARANQVCVGIYPVPRVPGEIQK